MSFSCLGLEDVHHVLLHGVSDNSVHSLQHGEKYRLLEIQIFLRLDVLFGVLSRSKQPSATSTSYYFSPGLQHFSHDEQDSVPARMLDLVLDATSFHHEIPRMLCDPGVLGHVVRWLEALRRGMPDDRKQPNVVIICVYTPRYTFALGYHSTEFGNFIGVLNFVAVQNLLSSSDEWFRPRN